MEHIVQFAIGIDDETIRKRVEENAYDDICERLVHDAYSALPGKHRNSWLATDEKGASGVDWRYLMEEQLSLFAEKHKDEIIEAAAKELAESFKRTKAYKERMKEVME